MYMGSVESNSPNILDSRGSADVRIRINKLFAIK